MRGDKYSVAVALLAVLAVAFGLAGTLAPGSELVSPQSSSSSSSSDSVTHFVNPPTYDSNWTDIRNKTGQYFALMHGLNTTEAFVDIRGKQSLDLDGGALVWGRTYGGSFNDYGRSVVQTLDGGYALGGFTESFGAVGVDGWLVKFNSAGYVQWNRTFGGSFDDYGYSVVQTFDGGYALAGRTNSFGAAGLDGWLVKFDSAGTVQWNTTYGGSFNDFGHSLVQTFDGGYALAGQTGSFGAAGWDGWLVKFGSAGNVEWNTTYGGAGTDYGHSLVQTFDGGYALAGQTGSFGAVGADFWLVKFDSAGNVQWNTTYGGSFNDYGYSLVQTFDGGYALAGRTGSSGPVGWDGWLVKFDFAGNVEWNKTFGGSGDDYGYSVVQTFDGGYALGGYTNSFGAAGLDGWLVKVSSEMSLEHQLNIGGTVVVPGWGKTFGGSSDDYGYSLVQTLDGGYALAGRTGSFGSLAYRCWLVKFDSAGNVQWNTTYGGSSWDFGYSVVQTFDGGYALGGFTQSFGAVNNDGWLVKFDSAGTVEWNTTYGGSFDDHGYSVVQTFDGGYALGGYTNSFAVSDDGWLVKFDSAGTVQWNTTYGGAGNDESYSLVQTFDGGYALGGYTHSFGAAGWDGWLVKFDSAGTVQWNTTYGGSFDDHGYSVVQTFDGGYALGGYTHSFGAAGLDGWLVKFDSAGTVQWNTTYGGAHGDIGHSVVQTFDGGYALGGYTHSFGAAGWDGWLVKFDSAGTVQWDKTFGVAGDDYCRSVVQTSDGGYALGGYTNSFGAGGDDGWLVKTDVENGLAWTSLTNYTVTLYRGKTDPYWNYVRVRIWTIKEPTWMFGDINQDGIVDAEDLYIVSRNYGKTFSALSLTGIIGIASVYTYKKRKKQPK